LISKNDTSRAKHDGGDPYAGAATRKTRCHHLDTLWLSPRKQWGGASMRHDNVAAYTAFQQSIRMLSSVIELDTQLILEILRLKSQAFMATPVPTPCHQADIMNFGGDYAMLLASVTA